MLTDNSLDVHVDNLASGKVLVEKGDANVLGLGDRGQELLFSNLSVGTVAKSSILLFLLVISFHGFHALFFERSHYFFRFFVHKVIKLVVKIRSLLLLLLIILFVISFNPSATVGVVELLLHHSGLVFNGLLKHHL